MTLISFEKLDKRGWGFNVTVSCNDTETDKTESNQVESLFYDTVKSFKEKYSIHESDMWVTVKRSFSGYPVQDGSNRVAKESFITVSFKTNNVRTSDVAWEFINRLSVIAME